MILPADSFYHYETNGVDLVEFKEYNAWISITTIIFDFLTRLVLICFPNQGKSGFIQQILHACVDFLHFGAKLFIGEYEEICNSIF